MEASFREFFMVCAACGFDNPPGFRFCGGCGARLEPTRETAAELPKTAERRQITVLFCDLVGSTDLSGRLDPEELRDVVREYQEACVGVVQRFEGYVAQYLGDGLLIYFGFPQAHEDDVQRGIHTGLGIVAAVAELSERLEEERGLSLAVRLGLHTGEVVAGEVGAGERREQLALGQTPNIAARLQGLAEPGTLMVSEEARHLAGGHFTFAPRGEHAVKGVHRPLKVFVVLGESGEGRFSAASARGLAPAVGRRDEMAFLLERFAEARSGQLQVVEIVGEAGIGKSRLLHDLRQRLAGEPHVWGTCHTSPFYRNSAFYAIASFLQKMLRFTPEDGEPARVRKLERTVARAGLPAAEVVPVLAALLSLPLPEGSYSPLRLSPQRQKEKILETLAALFVRQARQQTLVFALEDLHWIDASTLELLSLLFERAAASRLLVLLTCRPSFDGPWPSSRVSRLELDRLSEGDVERLVLELAGGRALPAPILAEIVRKTDGVPLFVEELTRMILESGLLREGDGRYELAGPLPSLAIPSTLQDSLMARLDRLNTVKEIAQLGSVLGREFGLDTLRAVASLPEEELVGALSRMVESEILHERSGPAGPAYVFRHALIQDAAYRSLLKPARQKLHRQVAEVLGARSGGPDEVPPELLAHHYTEAGLPELGLGHWLLAGRQALGRSANREAIGHLTRALELVPALPAGLERDGSELAVQVTLAPALCATLGYASAQTERAFARAHELCRAIGRAPQIPAILFGLTAFYSARDDLHRGLELGLELMENANASGAAADRAFAHHSLGYLRLYRGEFEEALAHMDGSLALAGVEGFVFPTGDGPCITKAFKAATLWYLGRPDQALACSEESIADARASRYLGNVLYCLSFATFLRHLRREPAAVRGLAEKVIELARELGSFWEQIGQYFAGWATAHLDDREAGLRRMRQALDTYRSWGTHLTQTCYVSNLAELDPEASRRLLEEALAAAEINGELFWTSEIHRLFGETALNGNGAAGSAQEEAERRFLRSLEIARSARGKALELRAATSLARLRLRQGRREEGREVLAGVYGWFTEGFDTADLREARQLLAELQQ